MTTIEIDLLEFLHLAAFRRGTFTLASGATSDYYIDCRKATMSGKGAKLIGQVLYNRTKDLKIDGIGGMAVGAVPLAIATVAVYNEHGKIVEGFFVREPANDHGTKQVIEGNIKHVRRAVVVEDVTTTGESAFKAVRSVQQYGCQVIKVLTLVDRLQGAEKLFAECNVPFESVFTVRDFGVKS